MKLMFWFWFTLVGKEYVCIVRLHEAIEKEAELAKVSAVFWTFLKVLLIRTCHFTKSSKFQAKKFQTNQK